MKKIAVSSDDGRVAAHFGHCLGFEVLEVDEASRVVLSRKRHPAPAHEPGRIPRWLKELGVNVVLTGRMGKKALELFEELGMEAVVGVPSVGVDEAIQAYLKDALVLKENLCDH
jgi:predicted Fe-Mo cluster-binding NifX family protein